MPSAKRARSKKKKGATPTIVGGAGLRQATLIQALAVAPHGSAIATGDADSVVRVLDAFSGELLFEKKWPARDKSGRHGIQKVFFSPDSARVYALTGINGSGDLCAADVDGKRSFHSTDRYMSIAVAPDGASLVAVTWVNGPLVLIDAFTGEERELERPDKTLPNRVAWFRERIAVLFYDHNVEDSPPLHKLWLIDGKTHAIVGRVDVDLEAIGLGFRRNGDVVVVGRDATRLAIRSIDAGTSVFIDEAVGEVYSAEILSSRDVVALRTRSRGTVLVDLASGAIVRDLPPDVSCVASAATTDLVVVARGVALERSDRTSASALTTPLRALRFFDDDRLLVTSDVTGVRAWNASDGTIAWSIEGKSFGLADGYATITDETSTRLVAFVSGEPCGKRIASSLRHVVLAPDASMLAVRSNIDDKGGILLYSPTTGELLRRLEPHGKEHIYGLAFSPDAERIASGVWKGGVIVTSVTDGGELARTQLPTWGPSAIAWSADGKMLAIGDQKKTVWLWSIKKDRLEALHGHRRTVVRDVAFSPDASILASIDDDTLRLWNVTTKAELAVQKIASASVLAFSSDGKRLAVGGEGFAHVYEVTDLLGF